MTKMLLRRVDKLGKAGITIISDIFRICGPYLDSNGLLILHINKSTKTNTLANNKAPISITIEACLI